jgi:hypothetical protein
MNTKDEAEIYAKIIGMQNVKQGNGTQADANGQLGAMASNAPVPGQAPGNDSPGNGEGSIGPGNTPMPGEMEFTGQVEEPSNPG